MGVWLVLKPRRRFSLSATAHCGQRCAGRAASASCITSTLARVTSYTEADKPEVLPESRGPPVTRLCPACFHRRSCQLRRRCFANVLRSTTAGQPRKEKTRWGNRSHFSPPRGWPAGNGREGLGRRCAETRFPCCSQSRWSERQ